MGDPKRPYSHKRTHGSRTTVRQFGRTGAEKKDDKTPDLEPQERTRRVAQIEPMGERLGKQTRFSRDELETGLRSRSLDSRQPSGPVALYVLVRCECAKI